MKGIVDREDVGEQAPRGKLALADCGAQCGDDLGFRVFAPGGQDNKEAEEEGNNKREVDYTSNEGLYAIAGNKVLDEPQRTLSQAGTLVVKHSTVAGSAVLGHSHTSPADVVASATRICEIIGDGRGTGARPIAHSVVLIVPWVAFEASISIEAVDTVGTSYTRPIHFKVDPRTRINTLELILQKGADALGAVIRSYGALRAWAHT